jgi:DNA-binding phage protein
MTSPVVRVYLPHHSAGLPIGDHGIRHAGQGMRPGVRFDTIMAMSCAGAIIKSARLHAGLSLREVARRAKTSHATLSRYEDGTIEPSFVVVERVVEACGLEMRVLLTEPDVEDRDLAASFLRMVPAERPGSFTDVDGPRRAVG